MYSSISSMWLIFLQLRSQTQNRSSREIEKPHMHILSGNLQRTNPQNIDIMTKNALDKIALLENEALHFEQQIAINDEDQNYGIDDQNINVVVEEPKDEKILDQSVRHAHQNLVSVTGSNC